MVVLVAAGVLVGPLQGQDGASVVVQAAHVVAAAVVVLGIEQPKGGGRERGRKNSAYYNAHRFR